jgi:hypothetical protein
MKRRWSIIRLIQAILLLGLSGAVFACWPRSASWQIPAEELIGFDETKGLLITLSRKDTVQELHSYNLTDGSLHSSTKIPFPKDTPLNQNSPWPFMLSPDKQCLVAASYLTRKFHLFRLDSATQWQEMRDDKHEQFGSYTYVHGYSQDGGFYVTRFDSSFEEDGLNLWDLRTQKLFATVLIRHPTTVGGGLGINRLPFEQSHVTTDHRYLAASVLGGYCVLYDLLNKQVIAQTEDHQTIPRFSKDGKSLIVLSDPRYQENTAVWYHLANGEWTFQGKKHLPFFKHEEYLQACDNYFVTGFAESDEREWYSKLPEFCVKFIEKIWPSGRVNLRFWDLVTGEQQRNLRVSIPESSELLGFSFGLGGDSANIKVSDDARFVARKHEDTISVWQTSTNRPLLCWLIIGGLLSVATRIAWPGKTKNQFATKTILTHDSRLQVN